MAIPEKLKRSATELALASIRAQAWSDAADRVSEFPAGATRDNIAQFLRGLAAAEHPYFATNTED